jgi:hypothetical protein
MGRRISVFLYGGAWHHIDHLAPLAQALKIPLIVTDEEVIDAIKKFYPAVHLHHMERFDAATYIVENFDAVISCLPKLEIDKFFFFACQEMGRRIIPIWCPHGQSDKGLSTGFLGFLKEERALLVYGERMLAQLGEEVTRNVAGVASVGAYRWCDYEKYRTFYDNQLDHCVRGLDSAFKTLLYAPTWNDSEALTSFFAASQILIETLPREYQLIIKPHPNLIWQDIGFFERMRDQIDNHPRVRLLEKFPLIFPLLARCDGYIGDASSVGYDFLKFNKPMMFLNQRKYDLSDVGSYLYRCGIQLLPTEYSEIYERWENMLPYDQALFAEIRQEVYQFAFGSEEIGKEEALGLSLSALLKRCDL